MLIFLLFLLRSHFLLCNLLFSVYHTASQVVKTRSWGDSHHSAFSQLPRNSVGPLGVPPKPGSSWWLQAQCPGKGSSQLSPLASRNFLCLLAGPAIRGPSDSDAVFHLRRDRDAGRTAPQAPLLYLLLLLSVPSLLLLTVPLPQLPLRSKSSQELELPPKQYFIGSRANGQEQNTQLRELLSPWPQAWVRSQKNTPR